jgi:hypothetical protein
VVARAAQGRPSEIVHPDRLNHRATGEDRDRGQTVGHPDDTSEEAASSDHEAGSQDHDVDPVDRPDGLFGVELRAAVGCRSVATRRLGREEHKR